MKPVPVVIKSIEIKRDTIAHELLKMQMNSFLRNDSSKVNGSLDLMPIYGRLTNVFFLMIVNLICIKAAGEIKAIFTLGLA